MEQSKVAGVQWKKMNENEQKVRIVHSTVENTFCIVYAHLRCNDTQFGCINILLPLLYHDTA